MSPFKSGKQRAYLYAKKPAVARKFSADYGTKPKRKKLRRTKKSSPRY